MNRQAASADEEGGRVVEVRARTVDEAVARGLVRLGGLSRSEVKIDVLSEGKGGLLGFGAEEAVVRLTVLAGAQEQSAVASAEERAATDVPRPPAGAHVPPAAVEGPPEGVDTAERAAKAAAGRKEPGRAGGRRPAAAAVPGAAERVPVPDAAAVEAPEDVFRAAVALAGRYLELLGFSDAVLERGGALLPLEVEEEPALVLNVRGTDTKRLLARDGRPLLALQFLVRLALNRETGTWVNLLLDVDGDRARRVKELFHLAEQSAELVDRDGRPVSLPPMTAYERRVVHLALRDHPVVITQSIGSGETRKVTVRLKGQLLPGV